MHKNQFLPILSLAVCLFFGFAVQAQSINEQFKTVVDGSNNYQEYKVIKQAQIKQLWSNAVDSLKRKDAKYLEISQQISNQKTAIQKQKTDLANKENSLQETLNSVNEISLLGIFTLEKGSYKLLMWSLVLILAILVGVFYFSSFAARKEAKYRIKLFEEVQEEYKVYKAKANENEKKLARALQDERNRLAEYNIR
ncbi:hypothetical protein [Pedobacter arcticus]|uniref:hypothetical protein n=1 Tax=Pedobacter arcticus TaxID=752140 RepID=UPI0002D842C6|nr:hypothetical protein [Pedobacter arcticus]